MSLLRSPESFLLIQTPCYPAGMSYEALCERDHPFLVQLTPLEHLYLFSEKALALLCAELGLGEVRFEPAIFAHYDQYAVASAGSLRARRRRARPDAHGGLAAGPLDTGSARSGGNARCGAGGGFARAPFAGGRRQQGPAAPGRKNSPPSSPTASGKSSCVRNAPARRASSSPERPCTSERPGRFLALMSPAEPPIRLAVDLSNLRPGGENGGIKPFLFETLLWLGRQRRTPLQFVYLTSSSTHTEVCDELARVGDEIVSACAAKAGRCRTGRNGAARTRLRAAPGRPAVAA